MMNQKNFHLIQALAIFLLSALWGVLVAGTIEYLHWDLLFEPGLLIHSGIIFICISATAVFFRPLTKVKLLNLLSLNLAAWPYYCYAALWALVIWFADYWLQLYVFLDDGQKDSVVLQADTRELGMHGIVIASCILAPISEEILFRGILLRGLLNKLDPLAAIILSSLLFSIIHFSVQDFISLFVVSVIYALITLRAQSIQPSIVAHLINNSMTIYYLSSF